MLWKREACKLRLSFPIRDTLARVCITVKIKINTTCHVTRVFNTAPITYLYHNKFEGDSGAKQSNFQVECPDNCCVVAFVWYVGMTFDLMKCQADPRP